MEPRFLLTAYVVESTADDGSAGTLRWAILQVNANSGPAAIQFDIPGTGVERIAVLSPLPVITNPVLIDGTTEPNFAGHPLIQIDGSGAGADCDGLILSGGHSVVQGLVVSGFSGTGIVLNGGSGNLVQANQVGTDPSGTIAQPNGEGIEIIGSSSNTIGGTASGAANLVSGNLGAGIELVRSNQNPTANLIAGNLIGTTANGSSPLGNRGSGIILQGGTGNFIGASNPAVGNVVSGNLQNGIELTSGATATQIVANLIGTTANGLDPLGNQEDGVLLDSATANTIGGTSAGQGNVISGNLGNGVETHTASTSNLLEGNDIGTDRSGKLALGNAGNGVSLGSSDNSIGGLVSGAGNMIAYNGTGSVGAGVQLVGLVNQNTILSNSIHDNAGLGINLGNGPTPNHQPGTPGPNNYQNYPIFTSAQTDGKTTTIVGTLLGAPKTSYTIQVFWSPTTDPSGYGEGQNVVTTTSVTTDSTGNGLISISLAAATPPGAAISATATDSAGNTSEFSPDITIRGVTDLKVSIVASPNPVGINLPLTYTVTVSNSGSLAAHDVVLTDQVPYAIATQSVTASQGSPPVVSNSTVTASLGTLAAGGTATLTIVGTVQSGAGASLTDNASVTLDEIDPTPANLSASVTTKVAALANLSLAMASNANTVHVGDSFTYTMTASNQGPNAATDVVISLPLGAAVTFSSVSTTQGSASFASGQLAASLGSLAVGSQATVSVVVQALGVGTFSATASISSDQANSNPGNESATVSVVVEPVVGLAVSIAANPSPVAVGQNLVYTVDVTNHGPDAASAVTLTNVLPAGVTFLSASSNVGSPPTFAVGTVTAAVGALPSGSVAILLITVQPTAPPGSTLVDTASVSCAELNDGDGQSTASSSVAVLPSDNLAVTLARVPGPALVGMPLTLTATVSNFGPSPATGVNLQLPLSAAAQLVSVAGVPASPTVQVQAGALLANLGSLAVGASTTLTITLEPMVAGPATFTATVSGDEFDLVPANNQAAVSVVVDETPGVLQFASPSNTVNDTAGVATISVVRTTGELGTVTVQYQTVLGAAATPGLNYEPSSGTLTFADGQTTATILVPVLHQYYNNHDNYVALTLTAPTGGAVLGTTTTTLLRIHDPDPDFTPPQVTGLNWYGRATAITSIVLSFSEPLQATSASNPADYQLADLGTSGLANPSGSFAVGFYPPVYNAATDTVTLFPVQPMAAGHFYRIQVDGTGATPVLDLAGNALAGASSGMTGTNYMALIGRGTTLKYFDQTGNLVTLKVTGGGYLDEIRDPTGNGLVLTLEDGIPHKTVLSGTVARRKGKGSGVTTIGVIEGLGKFGDIRVKLTSPPFMVREYPFTLAKGRPLAVRR